MAKVFRFAAFCTAVLVAGAAGDSSQNLTTTSTMSTTSTTSATRTRTSATSTTTTSTTTTSTTTTLAPTVALALSAQFCSSDGNYWMLGKTSEASPTPVYRRRYPLDDDVLNFYMFYGPDCWGTGAGLWGSQSRLAGPVGGCGDDDVTCHLADACASRLMCDGTGLNDEVWVIAAARSDERRSCQMLARFQSSDRSSPPIADTWNVVCPSVAGPNPVPLALEFSEVVTTTETSTSTTATSTSTFTTTNTTTTVTTTSTEALTVVVEATPRAAQPCNRVTFFAYATTGAKGAAVDFAWSFGGLTLPAVRAVLEPSLAASVVTVGAPAPTSTLRLDPAEVSAAFAAAQQHNHSEAQLEVRVVATNVDGTVGEAGAIVAVRDVEPQPTIRSEGPTVVRAAASEPVRLAVQTGEVAPSCSAGRGVAVAWEYKAPGMPGWVGLDAADFMDLSRQPGVLDFAPRTFQPQSLHMFRARALYPGSAGSAASAQGPSTLFRVMVAARPPPTALIVGPRVSSFACGFALDASGSTDPSADAADLVFSWTCAPDVGSHLTDCAGFLANFAAENASRADGHGAAGRALHIEGGQLPKGSYLFTVSVRRRQDGPAHAGSASWAVRLENTTMPSITVSAPWEDMARLSNTGARLAAMGVEAEVVAHLHGSHACQAHAGLTWRWALVELGAGPGAEQRLVSLTETEQSLLPDGYAARVRTGNLQHHRWAHGEVYSMALLHASDFRAMALLEAAAPMSLSAALDAGASVAAYSPTFVVDAPPTSGTAAVVPPAGETVRTMFTVATSGWVDEEPSSLAYAFYRFPAGGAAEVLPLEWENASSPDYWVARGGEMLRSWGASPELPSVALPSGRYFLVARARDGLGAEGVPAATELSVMDPVGSLSMAEIEEALGAVEASNNPVRLLDVATVVARAVASGSATAERQAITNRLIGVIEAAVSVQEASGDITQKVGQGIASVLAAGGGSAAGRGNLVRSVLALDTSLNLVVQADVGGTSQGAGDAVLNAVAAIDAGLDDGEQRRRLQAGSSAASDPARRLLRIVSKLGLAAQQALAVGEVQHLQATGPDGRPWLEGSAALVGLEDLEAGTNEVLPGLVLPPVRNLRQALGLPLEGGCGSLGLQQTEWLSSNPLRAALVNSTVGLTHMKVVELRLCGGPPIELNRTQGTGGAATSSLWLSLWLPPRPEPEPGFVAAARCFIFDGVAEDWSTNGVEVAAEPDSGASMVMCKLSSVGGAYAAGWEMVAETVAVSGGSAATFTAGGDGAAAALVIALCCVAGCCACAGLYACHWHRARQLRLKHTRVAAAKLEEDDNEDFGQQLQPIEDEARPDQLALRAAAKIDYACLPPEELFALARTTPSPPPDLVVALDAAVLARRKARATAAIGTAVQGHRQGNRQGQSPDNGNAGSGLPPSFALAAFAASAPPTSRRGF